MLRPNPNFSEADFKIIHEIGRGSFGVVYEVNKISGSLANHRLVTKKQSNKVRNAFCVKLLFQFSSTSHSFLVMALAETSLNQFIERNGALAEETIRIMNAQIIEVLSFLHECQHGIIHREI